MCVPISLFLSADQSSHCCWWCQLRLQYHVACLNCTLCMSSIASCVHLANLLEGWTSCLCINCCHCRMVTDKTRVMFRPSDIELLQEVPVAGEATTTPAFVSERLSLGWVVKYTLRCDCHDCLCVVAYLAPALAQPPCASFSAPHHRCIAEWRWVTGTAYARLVARSNDGPRRWCWTAA